MQPGGMPALSVVWEPGNRHEVGGSLDGEYHRLTGCCPDRLGLQVLEFRLRLQLVLADVIRDFQIVLLDSDLELRKRHRD
jgi:hypothetical protein